MKSPASLRDAQRAQDTLVFHCAIDEIVAHLLDFSRRRLDGVLDFLERERVIGALVPVTLTLDGVKRKAGLVGLLAPICPFIAWDALHDVQPPEKNPWPVPPKPPRIAPG